MDATCCICLMNVADCHKLNDLEGNAINWLNKLQIIVPELEQVSTFFNDSLICECCISQVENIHKFRHQLIQLIAKYKLQTSFQPDIKASMKHQQPSDHNVPDNGEGTTFVDISECTANSQIDSTGKGDDIDSMSIFSAEAAQHSGETGNSMSSSDRKLCEREITKCSDDRRARPYSCEMCELKFDYIKDILAHCKTVHSMNEKTIKPYNCDICNSRFSSFSNYSQHQKYHYGNRSYVCPLCGKTFITKSDLTAHEYIHQNQRKYKCPLCEKAFNTNKNLRTHNLVVHTDHSQWKFQCLVCEKKFPLKGNFDQHMKRHSGDKQHTCQFCEKCFVSATELKRHALLHTNIRSYACEHCPQEYKTIRTLNIHLKRAHSVGNVKLLQKNKKYVCHICPSQFYDKQKLTRHLYGHSGFKPFSCLACDKKFTDKSYMSHHLKIYHNIENLNKDSID